MNSKISPIPQGFHAVTPYLIIKNASKALEFYKEAFNATEQLCMKKPDGTVVHAEIKIGDSIIMMSEECSEMEALSPETIGNTPVSIHLYVEDVDHIFKQAIVAGAQVIRPVEDQFFGDRMGTLKDPVGHVWSIATHKEDVSFEELNRRFEKMMK